MADLFLGVDGGGSKTELVLLDAGGELVARALVGSTYHPQIGVAGVAARLGEGVAALLQPHGLGTAAISHAFFGLPAFGEDGVADPQLVAACAALLGHGRFVCDNDMVCGWAGSLGLADGINLVAGTGSIAYGERGGVRARAGGWGEVFGDEGSGHWIAMRGLQLFSRMSDGRVARGPLHAMLAAELALDHDLQLCERIMGPGDAPRERVAALAPVVVRAAAAGDAAASLILREAGEELAQLALALRTQLGFPVDAAVPLAWSGSILTKLPPVQDALVARLAGGPPFAIVAGRHSPAVGAALLARAAARGER